MVGKNKVIKLSQDLIRMPSRSGREDKAVKVLKSFFQVNGFDEVIIDKYGNCIGHIKGKKSGKGKKLLFDGHIDTVAVNNKWSVDPFEGKIIKNRLYGRGASDMKGALAAMAVAAAEFSRKCDKEFQGDIFVAGVVCEEIFEGVAARNISALIEPDYVVIGEASELNLKIGQRGRAEIVLETFGIPAHSANPEKGVNAVLKMIELINEVMHLEPPVSNDLGEGILVLTDIKSDPYPGSSVVPAYCKATMDRRLLVGETKEEVLNPIEDIIQKLIMRDPSFKGKASIASGEVNCYTGESMKAERFFPGWIMEDSDEFVEKALKGLKKAGLSPDITHYSFCTNGSHYAGEKGIKTIGFGPSNENLAHKDDEYIEISQLEAVVKGYYGILEEVFTK